MLQIICLPAELVIQYEIVIRPFESLTDTCCKSVNLHKLVIIEDIEGEV